jgi:hypothetical protein
MKITIAYFSELLSLFFASKIFGKNGITCSNPRKLNIALINDLSCPLLYFAFDNYNKKLFL